jgi:hypothetical protein
MNGEAELHFKRKFFAENQVVEQINGFPFKEHWKIEVKPKEFIAKFKPTKEKVLKQFKQDL